MHVPYFETWIVFVALCLVTCGSTSSGGGGFNVFGGSPRAKIQEIVSHKSLDANVSKKTKTSESFENAKKKAGVVENAGKDFYMVRSVINGDGKITGSSVSVLSKDTIDLTNNQVSDLSLEDRLDKTSKNKHQPRPNYTTKFGETMSLLMDEPSKGKF